MDREDFMDLVYSELASDPDNNRANRIIWAADGYAERRVNDALQVIKEQQSVKLGTNLAEVGTDLISRQAAIDALKTVKLCLAEDDHQFMDCLINDISKLPSAQPEPCEDAVSRKAVKDGFVEMCSLICPYTEKQRHIMCGSCLLGTAFDVLEATQPVTPKQRTGKWIKLDMHRGMADHKCTACEQECYVPTCMGEPMYAFCPNCGAKMEVTT